MNSNDTLLFKYVVDSYENFVSSNVAIDTLSAMGDSNLEWTKDVYRLLNRRFKNYEIANDNIDDFLDLLWEKIEIHTPNYLEQKKRYEQLLNMSDSQLLSQQKVVSEMLGISKRESELLSKHIGELKKTVENEIELTSSKKSSSVGDNKNESSTDNMSIENIVEHTDTRVPNPLDTPLENITNQTSSKGNEISMLNTNSKFENLSDENELQKNKMVNLENAINDDTKQDVENSNSSENKLSELFGDYSVRLRTQVNNSKYTIIDEYLKHFNRLFLTVRTSSSYI